MNIIVILMIFLMVCSCESKHPQNIIESARETFKNVADSFNQTVLAEAKTEDSLYALSKLNMDSGINAVNKYIFSNISSPKFYKLKAISILTTKDIMMR